MNCSQCGHDNPAEAAFCMKCGNSLAPPPCTSCGADVPAGAAFCMKCGTKVGGAQPPAEAPADASTGKVEQYIPKELLKKIESARASGGMRGERRTVTILFCDVQGSTAAAEQLDPEEWADIMNGAFEHLIAPVYRYEGMLARLMGDAILAFFGAPISHEDDPERAVLAALAIVNEIGPFQARTKAKWGIEVNVRVGINTGLVVVGEVGTDMRLEYTAMGDEVNLASRMESTATPGTVQLSESTYKLVAPLFDTEPLGEVQVKGKSEPVKTWRALRKKLEPGRLRGIEGLDSPMVGRDRELGTARGQLEQLRRGAGQVLGVIAEAGLGKSRLLAELKAQAESEGFLGELSWLEARAVSYETSAPYAPFTRMLRELWGLEGLKGREAWDAVTVGLEVLVEDRVEELAPYLAHLLGVDVPAALRERVDYLTPPEVQAKTNAALIEIVERIASRKPTLLVLEDLHWADPASLEVAGELLAVAERAGLMLVALLRPRRSEGAWLFHERAARESGHLYASIHLSPLDDQDGRALIDNLLRIEGMSDELRELILKRAEGNPYFVEELIRSLLDRGALVAEGDGFVTTAKIENIAIPDTLQGVLNTRLDQLDEGARRVAQTAAVIGREFAFDTLASMHAPLRAVEEGLTELIKRGIVRETARLPERKISFKHALMRDAAYESLLLKTRRELHRTAAEVLEKLAPDERAAIAHHFLQAREQDLALPHLVAAGSSAASAYANEDARRLLTQAVDIAESIDAVDLGREAMEALGEVLKLSGDVEPLLANYQRLLAYGEKHDDGSMRSSAHNKLGFVYTMFFGDMARGEQELKLGEQEAKAASCEKGLAEASMIQCNVYTAQARFEDAKHYLEQAIKVGEESAALEPRLYGMTHIANTLVYMTEIEKAGPHVEETLALALEHGNKKYEAELKAFAVPYLRLAQRDVVGAIEVLDEALDLSRKIGATAAESGAAWLRGSIALYRGDYERALELNERAIAYSQRSGYIWYETAALCVMGTTYLSISQRLSSRALELHEQAFEQMEDALRRVLAAANWCELGFCALAVGKVEAAQGLFERALSDRSPVMYICEPHLHAGLAFTALATGDLERAQTEVRKARASVLERSLEQYHPLVLFAEGQVAAASSRPQEAIERFGEAMKVCEEMGFLPLLWQSAAGAAAVHDSLGDEERSAALRARAQEVIDSIAGQFSNGDLRQAFVDDARERLQPAA
jgi:class 3 adenylate cyclase/tetratricopeptide (TPR) repeat protein